MRVFFREPHNVRGRDRLLCFVSEHTVGSKTPQQSSSIIAPFLVSSLLSFYAPEHSSCSSCMCTAIHQFVSPEPTVLALDSDPADYFVELSQRYPFCVVFNDAKWNLEKRFSEFAELDKQLDEIYKGDSSVQAIIAPPPPPLRHILPHPAVKNRG